MPKYFEFTDSSPTDGKTTSGLWRDLERGVKKLKKKLIPTDALNEFWRAGRGALDSLALSSGIPLSNLRQNYRTVGIDPEKLDAQIDAALAGNTDPTAQDWEDAVDLAESKGKLDFPILAVTGVILASILLFSGRRGLRRAWTRHGWRIKRGIYRIKNRYSGWRMMRRALRGR